MYSLFESAIKKKNMDIVNLLFEIPGIDLNIENENKVFLNTLFLMKHQFSLQLQMLHLKLFNFS